MPVTYENVKMIPIPTVHINSKAEAEAVDAEIMGLDLSGEDVYILPKPEELRVYGEVTGDIQRRQSFSMPTRFGKAYMDTRRIAEVDFQ